MIEQFNTVTSSPWGFRLSTLPLLFSLFALALILSAGCHPSGGGPEVPVGSEFASQSGTTDHLEMPSSAALSSPESSPKETKTLQHADEVLQSVEQIRGLKTDHPVKKGFMNRASLREVLLEKISEEQSDEDIRDEAKGLKRMGLIPEDLDLKGFMLELYTDQIAGFYDDATQSLFLMEGQSEGFTDEVLSHELFHAIQDQRFGIANIRGKSKDNSDRLIARIALIEGDATGVMIDYSMRGKKGATFSDIPGFPLLMKLSGSIPQAGAFGDAPLVIKESLIFPYIQGVIFVYEIKRAGGWEAVNRLYEDLPNSSEQILHPERYLKRDVPVSVSFELPADFISEQRELSNNVQGELGFLVYFKHHLRAAEVLEEDAVPAAEGWGGDRVKIYEDSDGHVSLFQLSTWDTEKDAEEAEALLNKTFALRFSDAEQTLKGESGLFSWRSEIQEGIYVERRGQRVLCMEGLRFDGGQPQAKKLNDLRQNIWSSSDAEPPSPE